MKRDAVMEVASVERRFLGMNMCLMRLVRYTVQVAATTELSPLLESGRVMEMKALKVFPAGERHYVFAMGQKQKLLPKLPASVVP